MRILPKKNISEEDPFEGKEEIIKNEQEKRGAYAEQYTGLLAILFNQEK